MRHGILVFVVMVFAFSCNKNSSDQIKNPLPSQIIDCMHIKDSAYLELSRGNVFFLTDSYMLNAREKWILNEEYRIFIEPLSEINCEDSCFKSVMDSFIFSTYGKDFLERIQQRADSIDSLIPGIMHFDGSYYWADKQPKFIAGEDSFRNFNNLFSGKSTTGHVTLMFKIDTTGSVSEISVLTTYNAYYDSIAIEKLKTSKWTPARLKTNIGKQISYVKVPFREQITFFIMNGNYRRMDRVGYSP